MKIKVCGMKFPENIASIAVLQPDYMGFIFYAKSPRYAEPLDVESLQNMPSSIKKIGVFVNEDIDRLLTLVYKYSLDGVQLHGSETPEICLKFKEVGLIVIKAFPIADAFSFNIISKYENCCDLYVFDTKTDAYGGSGQKFDWSILEAYKGNTPFLLSGGISSNDAEAVLKITHPQLAGVDLNSKFEISPGLKKVELLRDFIKEIRN